jgi:plasmid segregation protein ParM
MKITSSTRNAAAVKRAAFFRSFIRGDRLLRSSDIDFHFCTVDIREAFLRKTQREINEHIIDEVLCKGTANIVQADMKIIKAEVQRYVAEIFHRLRDHGYDENTMLLYITGGGGCLVKNFHKYNADRIQFVDDICAAAKGYEYLAETMMKSGRI